MLLTLRLSVTPQYIMAALVACFGLAARTASLRGTGIWCSVCKSLWLHSGRASFPVGYHRPWVRNHKWDSISELLIAYRIWRVERAATSVLSLDATSLTRAIIILVESCAVCFVFLLLLIGTYAARSPVMFIILDMTSPVNMRHRVLLHDPPRRTRCQPPTETTPQETIPSSARLDSGNEGTLVDGNCSGGISEAPGDARHEHDAARCANAARLGCDPGETKDVDVELD